MTTPLFSKGGSAHKLEHYWRSEHRHLVSLLPFGEPIAVCRGHPFAHAAFAI
jgi:hypothetical protein